MFLLSSITIFLNFEEDKMVINGSYKHLLEDNYN